MASSTLTFVNVTGAPRLSNAEAKRMRAHVTKTNFAKRREQKQVRRDEAIGADVARALVLATPPRTTTVKSDSAAEEMRQAIRLARIWSAVFLNFEAWPRTREEADWTVLLASEPAMLESSLAIFPNASEVLASDRGWLEAGAGNMSKASTMILERIASGTAYKDAVIAAVMTMAFAERMQGSDLGWRLHVSGFGSMLAERFRRGMRKLPPFLESILYLDAANHIFGFPRFYDRLVMEAVAIYKNPMVSVVDTATLELIDLRACIISASPHGHPLPPGLERRWSQLLDQVQVLRQYNDPCVQVAALAMDLVLHLSKDPDGYTSEPLAELLKDTLERVPCRPCLYMDLTSLPFFLGAIAAPAASTTREWFVSKMARAAKALTLRGCVEPIRIAVRGLAHERVLAARFQVLWDELNKAVDEMDYGLES